METKIVSSVSMNNKIIPIGLHYNYPLSTKATIILGEKFDLAYVPCARLNRTKEWKTKKTYELNIYSKGTSNLGIALASTYKNSTIKRLMKYAIANDLNTSLSYVIYILESKLDFFTNNKKETFNNVLLKCITQVFCNTIAP